MRRKEMLLAPTTTVTEVLCTPTLSKFLAPAVSGLSPERVLGRAVPGLQRLRHAGVVLKR